MDSSSSSRDPAGLLGPEEFDLLFKDGRALFDVRAPIEFAKGSVPGAKNLPILNDSERHQVGTTYRQEGQEAAVELGHRLVSGEVKAQRLEAWESFLARHPGAVLYCARGGQRSQIAQAWIRTELGRDVPRIRGGYKALRRHFLGILEEPRFSGPVWIVGGRTGVGKTDWMRGFDEFLDLEDLAWHRGSSFGRHATEQPTAANFENRLALEVLRHRRQGSRVVLLEDEGKRIGRCQVPAAIYGCLKTQKLLLLEEDLAFRIELTHREYIRESLAEFLEVDPVEGFANFAEALRQSLYRIRKRLGSARYAELSQVLELALKKQEEAGDDSAHVDWIRALLVDYYDPMYDYQLSQKEDRIQLRGGRKELEAFLASTWGVRPRTPSASQLASHQAC